MKTMKAAELVLDFELYPRNNVDSHNVNTICEALQMQADIPPVVICRKTKRVADGFHRVKAYLKHFGPDADIKVIEKDYKNDAAFFLDSMRYNSHHGAKLDPCDRTHCIIIAERLKISADAVAGALHMPVNRVGELMNTRTATSKTSGLTIPLKRTIIGMMAGKVLTKRQEEANERLSGMNQQFYANQLIELIESKMLDLEDDALIGRLRVLHDLLDGVLVAY